MDIVAETDCVVSHNIYGNSYEFQKPYAKGKSIVSFYSSAQDTITITIHSGKVRLVKSTMENGKKNDLKYSVKGAEHDVKGLHGSTS